MCLPWLRWCSVGAIPGSVGAIPVTFSEGQSPLAAGALIQKQVLWLQITENDLLPMQVLESLGQIVNGFFAKKHCTSRE